MDEENLGNGKKKIYLDTYPVGVYYQTVEMRSKRGDFT
jgi:hypothetical protein